MNYGVLSYIFESNFVLPFAYSSFCFADRFCLILHTDTAVCVIAAAVEKGEKASSVMLKGLKQQCPDNPRSTAWTREHGYCSVSFSVDSVSVSQYEISLAISDFEREMYKMHIWPHICSDPNTIRMNSYSCVNSVSSAFTKYYFN